MGSPPHYDMTDKEWECFQRECHPFPAYIDYLYGRPTGHEDSALYSAPVPQEAEYNACGFCSDPKDCACALASQAAPPTNQALSATQMSYPLHSNPPNSSSRQFLRQFRSLADVSMSDEPPNGLPLSSTGFYSPGGSYHEVQMPPVSRPLSSSFQNDNGRPLYAGPSNILPTHFPPQNGLPMYMPLAAPSHPYQQRPHIFRPNELLQPAYAILPQNYRDSANIRLIQLYDAIDPKHNAPRRQAGAKQEIIRLSVQLTREVALYTMRGKVHRHMPQIWQALKIRDRQSDNQELQDRARRFLMSVQQGLDPTGKAYVQEILSKMIKAQNERREPLAQIPGHEAAQAERAQQLQQAQQAQQARLAQQEQQIQNPQNVQQAQMRYIRQMQQAQTPQEKQQARLAYYGWLAQRYQDNNQRHTALRARQERDAAWSNSVEGQVQESSLAIGAQVLQILRDSAAHGGRQEMAEIERQQVELRRLMNEVKEPKSGQSLPAAGAPASGDRVELQAQHSPHAPHVQQPPPPQHVLQFQISQHIGQAIFAQPTQQLQHAQQVHQDRAPPRTASPFATSSSSSPTLNAPPMVQTDSHQGRYTNINGQYIPIHQHHQSSSTNGPHISTLQAQTDQGPPSNRQQSSPVLFRQASPSQTKQDSF